MTIEQALKQWVETLTTEQLEAKRQDIPFEVRAHPLQELAAIDAELKHRETEGQ